MCELFGLSASQPVSAGEALGQFRLRGGPVNPDGWGIAWREGGSFHVAKAPLPAHESEMFAMLCETACSNLMVAHVRKARFPPVKAMTNTHPFRNTCCGKEWVFAHNGLVPDVVDMQESNAVWRPSGETDSEYAFCHLLSHISRDLERLRPHTEDAFRTLARISEGIASHGKFNFLMSDGEYLMAYGHDRLHYIEHPGFHACSAALIATEPLHEGWIPFEKGELRIYRQGSIAGRILTQPHE